ncbi:uncharacterized protein LOC115350001 [Aquila chrysaetos chrysaetos]|uniref:uncharacterized protein LOC115350001 n=1 Tax=Aquila chrysaetos chrysaetos TaxID=223781 RepID=UPI0011767D43|nr:uncharacterized protein LOC115350001 [Aquila chrysaetos chrysaetos]
MAKQPHWGKGTYYEVQSLPNTEEDHAGLTQPVLPPGISLQFCVRETPATNHPKIQGKSFTSATLCGAHSNIPCASDVAAYQPQAMKRPWDAEISALQKQERALSSAERRRPFRVTSPKVSDAPGRGYYLLMQRPFSFLLLLCCIALAHWH